MKIGVVFTQNNKDGDKSHTQELVDFVCFVFVYISFPLSNV